MIVRGDTAKINIGKNVVVQDLSVLGGELPAREEDLPASAPGAIQRADYGAVNINDDVIIGPQCRIGKSTIESHAYISDKAVVGDGCTVERYGVVAGGAMLEDGKTVPSGQIWAGSPAKYLRDVTVEEKLAMVENAQQLAALSKIYAEETEKSYREVLDDTYTRIGMQSAAPIDIYLDKLRQEGYPSAPEDMFEIEHRVATESNNEFAAERPAKIPFAKKGFNNKDWEPLSYDVDKMSDLLKKYGVNTDMYEKAYQRFKHEPEGLERDEENADPRLFKDQAPWQKKYDGNRKQQPSTNS